MPDNDYTLPAGPVTQATVTVKIDGKNQEWNVVEVLNQISQEFQQSQQATLTKRYTMRNRLKAYLNNISNKENIVSTKRIYSTVRTMIALYFKDSPQVDFIQLDSIDEAKVTVWQRMAESDWEDMKMQIIETERLLFTYIMGCAVGVFEDYNKGEEQPNYKIYNPLLITFDPLGNMEAERFRFMGVQALETQADIKNKKFNQPEKFAPIDGMKWNMFNPWSMVYPANEGKTTTDGKPIDNTMSYVYYHYTEYHGVRCCVATNRALDTIGQIVILPKVLRKEKKSNRSLWNFCVSYFRDDIYSPLGTSVVDLLIDVQNNENTLLNYALLKGKRASTGGTIVVNQGRVNKKELSNITIEPKVMGIELREGEAITNQITRLPMESVPDDNYKLQETMGFVAKMSIGIDPLVMGIQATGDLTATQARIMQTNANVLLSFNNEMNNRYFKDFYTKWMKMYKGNLRGSKKLITFSTAFGSTNSIPLGYNDIKTKEDLKVILKTKEQSEDDNNDKKLGLQFLIPLLQGTQKTFAIRKMLEMYNMSNDEAVFYTGFVLGEIEARTNINALNEDIEVDKSLTEEQIMNDNHDVYLSVYNTASNTNAKYKAINTRLLAKQQQMQAQAQAAAANGVIPGQNTPDSTAGAAQNQMSNNAMNKESASNASAGNVPTIADIR